MPAEKAITRAAASLFMDKGYRAVTMDMVAEAAGLTKAAVYYHFRDKPSLMVQAVLAALGQARLGTEAVLAGPGTLRQRLEALAASVLRLPQPFSAFDAMLHEAEADLSPEQLGQIRAEEQRVAEVVETAIRAGAARGEVRADNPALVAHAFVSLLRAGQARLPDGAPRFPDTAGTAQVLVELLWEGIDPAPA